MNQDTVERIKASGLIAIVRGTFTVEKLVDIAQTLQQAGLTCMETTLNTTDALHAINQLHLLMGNRMLIGAGTVRTAVQFQTAVSAGAQFTVAPNYDPATIQLAQIQEILHLPGIFTPSEAQIAYAAGCPLLKLFPASIVGPQYLKALRAPLDDIGFVPTGGINANNIGVYRRAGAVAVGIGSALITDANQSKADLYKRAVTLRQAWDRA
ncbi:MAG: bifunctional 4-hydroxy-2-oxoglutarate aldolase/2-dehydro-3-deoxy-phosphogluconate aldolase [Chloroflexota bacterium]